MTKNAAAQVYEQAGTGPEDVDVAEPHDRFTANELITYEALGLCPEGGAEKFIWDEDNTYGGKFVVNPSGGLSKATPSARPDLPRRPSSFGRPAAPRKTVRSKAPRSRSSTTSALAGHAS